MVRHHVSLLHCFFILTLNGLFISCQLCMGQRSPSSNACAFHSLCHELPTLFLENCAVRCLFLLFL
uniref:Secreted protein n=1 Tax=Anguilla anguilla TaxID=7936 RepID=A0A0E9SL76_ANGAN